MFLFVLGILSDSYVQGVFLTAPPPFPVVGLVAGPPMIEKSLSVIGRQCDSHI